MKATGIVRRIDDLGRVVIPKEIRRTMRIREGDPLEIYTDRDGEVIFKKYSPIGELSHFSLQYAETLNKTYGFPVIITDRDAIIATSGVPKKEFVDKLVNAQVEALMEARQTYIYQKGQKNFSFSDSIENYFISTATPITTEGDVIGCVAVITQTPAPPSDIEIKMTQAAALFLGKQLES